MIDDQKFVYETALDMARKSYRDGNKRVLVVKGGPGTGKSVLAINLLVRLTNFFIDESQRVTLKDIGSVEEIQKYIRNANAESELMELESQFTCNGSEGYIAGLDDVYDITIPEFSFAMSWHLGNSTTWAIDPNSVNEIGCTHTAQGLEFDCAGVIIGNDLRYEKGNVIADEIIKNTYRTLMTRGQKGMRTHIMKRISPEKEIKYISNVIEKNIEYYEKNKR